jgi:membrane protease YdiL (CAAX protease family)
MINQFSSLEEYADYLDGCSLEELKEIASSIDRERYPERYGLVISQIDNTEADSGLKEPAPATNVMSNWFKSPTIPREKRIPWSYIFFAFSILTLFWLLGAVLGRWDTIKFRPWLAWPISTLIYIVFVLSLLGYGIKACKKQEFWPLVTMRSPKKIALEFFKSLLILIPIRIVIGLVVLIIGALIDTEMKEQTFIRYTTYAPNSLIVVFWLVLTFTVGPAIEEIFFRGFLYNALKTRFSLVIACIAQALIFSLYHQSDLLQSIWIFLFGVALAIIYERRRNLIAPFFVHSISNAFFAIPLLVVAVGNLHSVANSFEEATKNPNWLASEPPQYVERKSTGNEQWKYAIDTWGSRGTKQWKKEANAFQAVSLWFPDDRTSVAKAKLGLVAIYHNYIRDYRRAIVAARELRHMYSDQGEQCASALSHEGWSYYMLRDFNNSRKAFLQVIEHYSGYDEAMKSAQKGIKWLESIGHDK